MTKNSVVTVVVPKTASGNAAEQSQIRMNTSSATNSMKAVGKTEPSVTDDIIPRIKPSSFGQKR